MQNSGGAQCGAQSVVNTAERPFPYSPSAINGSLHTVARSSASGFTMVLLYPSTRGHSFSSPLKISCSLTVHRTNTFTMLHTVIRCQYLYREGLLHCGILPFLLCVNARKCQISAYHEQRAAIQNIIFDEIASIRTNFAFRKRFSRLGLPQP